MSKYPTAGLVLIACAPLVVGCGDRASSGAPQPAAAPAAAPTAGTPVPGPQSRNLDDIEVCTRIPAADVAMAAGGKPLSEAGFGGAACNYVIETPSDTEMYGISVSEPSAMQAMLGYISAGEKGEAIEGLGGEAWLGTGPAGDMAGETSQPALRLLRTDHAIDVHGPRKDVVLAVGRLAAERIH